MLSHAVKVNNWLWWHIKLYCSCNYMENMWRIRPHHSNISWFSERLSFYLKVFICLIVEVIPIYR